LKWRICLLAIGLLIASVASLAVISITHGEGGLPIYVEVDIKPGSWPNPINIKSKGVFAVAICGTDYYDIMQIDPATVRIYIEGIEEGVSPIRWSFEDVATPYVGEPGGGHALGGDGYLDLVFHFETQAAVNELGLAGYTGETIPLYIKGRLYSEFGGRSIEGKDYVWVIDLPGDVNSDAVVNVIDGVIICLAWDASPNPSPNWDPRADIIEDNKINILDAVVVASNWGQTP